MSWLVLIPWPETTWSAADRIVSRTPLPLTEAGRAQAVAWADELAAPGLSTVYSSDERASVETARIVGDTCRARHRIRRELAEVDAGLWEGLTTEELKRRYPKIFKRWYDDPSCVCPPEGEDVQDAAARLRESLDRVVRKHTGENLAVVLGPLAVALVRCLVESVEFAGARSLIRHEPLQYKLPDGTDKLPSGMSPSCMTSRAEHEAVDLQSPEEAKETNHAG